MTQPPHPDELVLLRTTRDRRRYNAWVLVLSSLGLQGYMQRNQGSLELWVPGAQAERAAAEIDSYEVEEARARFEAVAEVEEVPATRQAAWGSAFVVLSLVAFYGVAGPNRAGSGWHAAGASDAVRVLHGEWWRAFTALTLHADAGHLLSNVGLGAPVIALVMRAVGVGWGLALVVLAGAVGNVANALAYQTHHTSIGFSTAVFGAVGLVAGLAYVQRSRRQRHGLRPAWMALGCGLALLGLLGTSQETDVFAHLFGACAGLVLGLAQGRLRWHPRTWAGQTLAGLAALATVVGAWLLALRP